MSKGPQSKSLSLCG